MAFQLFLMAVSLALVIKGGDYFVRAAVGIAELLRLPRIVIGSTIMSLATTSPEIAVSVMSGMKGEPGLAFGNATGSVMCNIGLIGGTMALLGTVAVHRRLLLPPFAALAGLAVLACAFAIDGSIGRSECIALLSCGCAYFVANLLQNLWARGRPGFETEAAAIEREHSPPAPGAAACAGLFAVGFAMVVGGSKLLVDSAVHVAESLGVPPLVIGLTIVAIGTSLPELVAAILAARKNVSDLGVGNILGAGVANLGLALGTAGMIQPIGIARMDLLWNLPALLAFIGVFGWFVLGRERLGKGAGALLVAMQAANLGAVAFLATR